jgi:hypothetical protein
VSEIRVLNSVPAEITPVKQLFQIQNNVMERMFRVTKTILV